MGDKTNSSIPQSIEPNGLSDFLSHDIHGDGNHIGHHGNRIVAAFTDLPLPREMRFTNDNVFTVAAYSVLFLVAACGNLTIFITLFRNRNRKSRVNMFIMHLCIADLVVTFVMMPLEVAWQVTVSWRAGEVACRLLMFFRAFGFYLSSFILVCMSLDRYFAILKPLTITSARSRGRCMLIAAWLFSVIASIPQSVIFHLETHPNFPWFAQCVTFNFFPTHAHELAYNIFNFVMIYVFPLVVIISCYGLILPKISTKTREHRAHFTDWRRSGNHKIRTAKIRTLKMTLMIVFVFIVCWTPYYVISVWWWFDQETANKVSAKVQRGLFLFAVSSCCMDPVVYGTFSIDFSGEFRRCCCVLRRATEYACPAPQNPPEHPVIKSDHFRRMGREHPDQHAVQGAIRHVFHSRRHLADPVFDMELKQMC